AAPGTRDSGGSAARARGSRRVRAPPAPRRRRARPRPRRARRARRTPRCRRCRAPTSSARRDRGSATCPRLTAASRRRSSSRRLAAVATVETVRGPVELARLGPTLMHEHIFVLDPAALAAYGTFWGDAYWDETRDVARAAARLRSLVETTAIRTLVDPTVIGTGRFVPRIQRL